MTFVELLALSTAVVEIPAIASCWFLWLNADDPEVRRQERREFLLFVGVAGWALAYFFK